jgi:hypothetical protein
LYIPQLKKRFENRTVFTTNEILLFYRELEPSIPSSTVNWRVYSLVNLGVLLRIGKGTINISINNYNLIELKNS